MMARILLLVVLLVSVQAVHKRHPKFPKSAEDYENIQFVKMACTPEHDRLRTNLIEESKCAPREVFEYLEPHGSHLQITPMAVWVKRCVGLCDYDTYGSTCVPVRNQTRYVPVRVYNVRTNKESCTTFPIEEHLSCMCCLGTPEECAPPREFDARKCACRCPNKRERRKCRSKQQQLKYNVRWNPSKCACEEKNQTRLEFST